MTRALSLNPLLVVLATSALFAESAAAQLQKAPAIHYTLTDLGKMGPSPGQPLTITNNGLISEVVSVSDSVWHAMLSFHGQRVDLARSGGLGGPSSFAFDVNARGQTVGEAETPESDPDKEDFCTMGSQKVCHAFIWQNGVMAPLPLLGGRNSVAKGINTLGQVVGTAENNTLDSTCPAYDPGAMPPQYQKYQFKPVKWAYGNLLQLPTSGMDVSGKAFADPDGIAFKVNDSGQAVGASGTCTGLSLVGTYLHGLHATMWQNGSVIDMGNLGGVAPGFGNFAYDVNQWGQAAGTSGTKDGSFHAFFWDAETGMQDLGTVPGDFASVGLALNDRGDVTGVSINANGIRAFVRPKGGDMVDLNSVVPADSALFLLTACSVNSRGEIIGMAVDATGNTHGYLLTPGNGDGDAAAVGFDIEARSARFEFGRKTAERRLGWRGRQD